MPTEVDIPNLVEKQVGKKKRSCPKQWKKNQEKEKRLKKHRMREIPNCRCQCCNKITKTQAKKLFNKFINLTSHTEQNVYLQGCVKEEIPKRHRPRNRHNRPRRVFKYVLDLIDINITVCAKAFLAIHGLKRDRLKEKVLQKHKDIADGRGKHKNHPRKVTEENLRRVHNFIEGLPSQVSHYSRSHNKHRKYIAADLSIAELHRRFISKNLDLKENVSYEKFRDIFNHDFNLSFGTPRKDICHTCEKLKVDIQSAELSKDENKIKGLKTEKELHLRKAEVFFDKIKRCANNDQHTLAVCFDYQKNLPLPVTNVQDEYYRRQLWLYNFGVHNIKENTACMYLYTENYAKKGPNEVISALDDYIKQNKRPEQTHFKIFADNCFSQNKNKYIFGYLDQLCCKRIFETIVVTYPIPGHSMMPVDRDFGLVELKRLKKQTVYSPDYYVDLVKKARIIHPFDIVFLQKNLTKNGDGRTITVKNYKALLDGYVKSITGISKCREVRFSRNNRPSLRTTATGPMAPFSLYRVGAGRAISIEPDDAYSGPLSLKPAKVQDIHHLLQFIATEERDFYKDVVHYGENEPLRLVGNDSEEEVE